MANQNTNNSMAPQHHYLRTPVAAFFGFLAVTFILASIFMVWLNKTLTNTPTFVGTVSPIIQTPEVRTFVSKQAAEKIVESAPAAELSTEVLTPAQTANKTEEQLKPILQTEIESRVQNVLSSEAFIRSWNYMIESTHAQLISELNKQSDTITLDFSPAIHQAVDILAKDSLKVNLDSEKELGNDVGKVTLQRDELGPAVKAYDSLKPALLTLIILAVASAVVAVWLSVHHMKTFRRMMIMLGTFSLILLLLVHAPHFVKTSGIEHSSSAAAVAISDALFADLKTTLLIVAIASFVLAFGSKFLQIAMNKRDKNNSQA